jgi:hypothetical protein
MPRQKHATIESPSEQQYKRLIHQQRLIIRSGMPHLERLPKRRGDFLKAYAETLNISKRVTKPS